MGNFQFFDVILLALVAGFIAFRLYTVLGRRTGHERSPEEQMHPETAPAKTPLAQDNVVSLPDRGTNAVAAGGPLARALLDIKLLDRTFDNERFLEGARQAHEMIVTAFAKDDRDTLRPLVSEDVFASFDAELRRREAHKERIEFAFAALKSARITGAELKGRTADVTVTFDSEIIQAKYDADGKLLEGEPGKPHEVTDVWTFARETNSRDPNWSLVATASS